MQSKFCVRISLQNGVVKESPLFDSLEEASRWRLTLQEDPLVVDAVMVQVIPEPERKPAA